MKRMTLIALMLAASGYGAASCAQALRDPTVAPAAARAAADASAPVKANPLAIDTGKVAVLVRNGAPYLVLGTRLYGAGQQVGAARIERITESEIWLREAGKISKIKVYQGVERRPAVPAKSP